MAWEWSHTVEAYAYARQQLAKEPESVLREIAQEWVDKLELEKDVNTWFQEKDTEALTDFIWIHASSYEHGRTCTNGGGELYMCPHGCHTVDLADMPEEPEIEDCW